MPIDIDSLFTLYTNACDRADEICDDESIDLQISTWEDLKKAAGMPEALRRFHAWQATWPAMVRYSTDPEGN